MNRSDCQTRNRARRLRRAPQRSVAPRRGVAILVVLLVISVAFSLSYAIMRSQGTALLIQHNADLGASARQAAMTGLTMGLKKMHTAGWEGVDTTLAGSVDGNAGFQVTFTVGDPSLGPADKDYAELPFRVTLLSTGYAADSHDAQRVVTHRMRAVARLIPRRLADEPSDWETMQKSTVHQSREDSFEVEVPCQLLGRVRVQGRLEIAPHYPDDGMAWWRYMRDLNWMRSWQYPDYRPLVGPVHLPFAEQDNAQLWALSGLLGVTVRDSPVREAGADWRNPSSLTSYRLYPGGASYAVTRVGDVLENLTLEPDPQSNPLGIFYRSGSITIRDNVRIRGSLFCPEDIRVEGQGVRLESLELPGLAGSEIPLRLPVVSCRNFVVQSTGGGSLVGLAAVFDDMRVDKGPESTEFSATGRVITRKLHIKERQPWDSLKWHDLYAAFDAQLHAVDGSAQPFFPLWMKTQGRDPKPRLTIQPDATSVAYHWYNGCDPIFQPHPDDVTDLAPTQPGLRWELIEWTDNP